MACTLLEALDESEGCFLLSLQGRPLDARCRPKTDSSVQLLDVRVNLNQRNIRGLCDGI